MNREAFTTACMKPGLLADHPYPLPAHDLARHALDLYYDQGLYQDRPDIAAYLVDCKYCGYANECFTHFYDMRSQLPYGIDGQGEITAIAYSIAQDCFGRKGAWAATRERIERLTAEFNACMDLHYAAKEFIENNKSDHQIWQDELDMAAQCDPQYYQQLLAEEPIPTTNQLDWTEEAAHFMY